jgi:hypothetical protein
MPASPARLTDRVTSADRLPAPPEPPSPPIGPTGSAGVTSADAAGEEAARRAEFERAEGAWQRSWIREAALRRDAESLSALREAARESPSPAIRRDALEVLWRAAADGVDDDGRVLDVLADARRDPSPEVRDLAERALVDLEALAVTREEAAIEQDSSTAGGG